MSKQQKNLALMYVGIDVAKELFEICALNEKGKILTRFEINADKEGFLELISQLPEVYIPSFALEDTGPYSGNLVQFLQQTNCQVICSNPYEIIQSDIMMNLNPIMKSLFNKKTRLILKRYLQNNG